MWVLGRGWERTAEGGMGMSTAPVASVLCSALDAVFVMATGAAGVGLQQQGPLPQAHQLLQHTLEHLEMLRTL